MTNNDVGSASFPERVGGSEVLEELADDMLRVLERLNRLEEGQAKFTRIGEDMGSGITAANRSVEALRRDLLTDRKALAIRGVVAQVAPALESLSCMRDGLDPNADPRVRSQLHSIVTVLENLLLGMEVQPFTPQPGDPFDAHRMESAGYAEGPKDTVVHPVHRGYVAGQIVIRPAVVLIGNILSESSVSADSNSEEL